MWASRGSSPSARCPLQLGVFVVFPAVLVAGFVCLFMPVASIQSFCWVMLVLSVVSTFTNLVLMRLFIKMYLALNNENGSKCNFHKGGKDA